MFLPEIDLHLHSTASDGAETPARVVQIAKQLGLAAISITDHDTVDGVSDAVREGEKLGVEVVPGMEISSQYKDHSVHILGYFVEYDGDFLREFAKKRSRARLERAEKFVRRLKEAGFPIDMEAVLAIAGEGIVGRAHIALALLSAGAVSSVDEAFHKYLTRSKPYYVPLTKPSSEEAVRIVHQAGGVAALAHPMLVEDRLLNELLDVLLAAGIDAIEVLSGFSSGRRSGAEKHLSVSSLVSGFATQHGLARTGGSDFHGAAVKGISIGSAHVPLQFLNELKERHASRQTRPR